MSSIFYSKDGPVEFPILITANDTPSVAFTYNGTKAGFHPSGDFDGGTLNIEFSLNGGVSFVIDATFAMTDEGIKYISEVVPSGAEMRLVVTGAATAPDLSIGGMQGGYR